MRGDRPITIHNLVTDIPFTPHARGSTIAQATGVPKTEVYPACAGIDLKEM